MQDLGVGFTLTKLVAAASSPLAFVLVLLVAGLVALWIPRATRIGRVVTTAGVALLLLVGTGHVSRWLLQPLEFRHAPVDAATALPDSALVVVLGSGHTSDRRLPPTAWLSETATARLAEGIRLHRAIPGSRLLLSGSGILDPVPHSSVLAAMAVSLGVDPADLVLEPRPVNTAQEAAFAADHAAGRPVVLVTSASHLPRAVRLFEAQGLDVLPAPTDYRTARRDQCGLRCGWAPQAANVLRAERALYEYLALARDRIRGAGGAGSQRTNLEAR